MEVRIQDVRYCCSIRIHNADCIQVHLDVEGCDLLAVSLLISGC